MEFLAQRHGDSVLQLGAPKLEYILKFFGLVVHGLHQITDRLNQGVVGKDNGKSTGRRVHIVGGLTHVDVVVGMQVVVLSFDMSHNLEATVGNHLVHVHVGTGAGSSLNKIDRKLIMKITVHDFFAGLHNRVGLGLVEVAELVIRQGTGLFDHGKRANELGEVRNRNAGYIKVLDGTHRLNAVVAIVGDLLIAEQIMLHPKAIIGRGRFLVVAHAGESGKRRKRWSSRWQNR